MDGRDADADADADADDVAVATAAGGDCWCLWWCCGIDVSPSPPVEAGLGVTAIMDVLSCHVSSTED